jgi:hypothetical protein
MKLQENEEGKPVTQFEDCRTEIMSTEYVHPSGNICDLY